ncbi:MAG TPA: hypothetical protein VF711_12620 [Acidimicrobiales bacterium]|jgi:hypothetical protein
MPARLSLKVAAFERHSPAQNCPDVMRAGADLQVAAQSHRSMAQAGETLTTRPLAEPAPTPSSVIEATRSESVTSTITDTFD